MPPLKGMDSGLNGELLKALWEAEQNSQIALIGDKMADEIPLYAKSAPYKINSTAKALEVILKHVPTLEGSSVLLMRSDAFEVECPELRDAMRVARNAGLDIEVVPRLGSDSENGYPGFFELVNDPGEETLYVPTLDERRYACARIVVGYSIQPINPSI